jgi:uracil-DNA glycosylase
MNSLCADIPKLLKDPAAVEARRRLLYSEHMAPLTEFVNALRIEKGNDARIPDFDPWDGGIHAEVLYLLEAPGPKAKDFVSRNNPDETAKNFFEVNRDAGIPRTKTVTWNIVPWFIGTETRIRTANRADIKDGIPSLLRLLRLLPRLRAIVLIGRKAQRVESTVAFEAPHLCVFRTPHPSPKFVNRFKGNRDLLNLAFREVAAFLNP